jgi:NADH-quinone oxidoreductase subunit G
VLSNAVANVALGAADLEPASGVPATASIYQLDGIVRRASSLQLTSDARAAAAAQGVAA